MFENRKYVRTKIPWENLKKLNFRLFPENMSESETEDMEAGEAEDADDPPSR